MADENILPQALDYHHPILNFILLTNCQLLAFGHLVETVTLYDQMMLLGNLQVFSCGFAQVQLHWSASLIAISGR